MTENAAGVSQWVGFFYRKQPHKICHECFTLDHTKQDCARRANRVREMKSFLHNYRHLQN